MSRPVPNPGILDIAPYTPGKSPVPEAGPQGVQAVGQRDAVRPLAEGDGGLQASRGASGGLSGRHLAGAARGDRPRLRARSRPHHLRRRFRRDPQSAGAHLSGQRRRGDQHGAWLSGLSDRDHGERRDECRSARDRFYRRRRCDPEAGLAADKTGVARQPEQPDRHLPAVRRGQAAARRAAAACAAGAGRRLFGLRVAQRLRARHRTGGDHRQYRDDPHVLENPRPRRAADRLDVRAGAHRRCGEPDQRAVQRLDAGDAGGGGRDRGHRAHPDVESAHRALAQLADGRDRQAWAEGDAERGELCPHPFPAGEGQDRPGCRRVPDQTRAGAARA